MTTPLNVGQPFPGQDRDFLYVQVCPDFVNGHHLSWMLDPTRAWPDANFFVQSQESPRFDQLLSNVEVGQVFTWTDSSIPACASTAQIGSWAESTYYRIQQAFVDGAVTYSHPVKLSLTQAAGRKTRYAQELIRAKTTQIRHGGRPGWLLKRKWNTKDVSTTVAFELPVTTPDEPAEVTPTATQIMTVDPVTGVQLGGQLRLPVQIQPEVSQAAIIPDPLVSTSKAGLYFPAVQSHFLLEARKEDMKLDNNTGQTDGTYRMSGSCCGYPQLDTYDILVDTLTGRRYSIQSRDIVLFPGTNFVISQNFQASLLQPSAPEYQLPVPE